MKRYLILGFILISTICGRSEEVNRIISGDLQRVKGPRSMVWQDCVGAGRVGEGLRDGWRRQLEDCHRELGFSYIRMHGLLHDELGVYTESPDGKSSYNWQYIDDVYDFLISIGMKPFVEFGFMPKKLASGTASIFWWNANTTPPNNYAKWDSLITSLVQHWTNRYGSEEVKTWRFEVWNEPNLNIFWQPGEGNSSRDAYFKLYEHTAKDVAEVNKDYKVGGPGGAGPVWTKELIDFCTSKDLPINFISFHSYGLGGGPSGLDQYGNMKLYLNPNLHFVSDTATSQNLIIGQSMKPKLPVYITEWSASYSPRDPIHDSYVSAPFILEQLKRTESVASMSYWTFTDVFEENGPVPKPFHGGFGLINYEGIRKPAFWAYKFLSMLGEIELQNSDASSYICTDSKKDIQVLLWDLTAPTHDGKISNQDYFFKAHPSREKGLVTINLKNLPLGKYNLTIHQIGYKQNDPYSHFLEMGSPSDLSREDVVALKKLSSGVPSYEATVNVENGTFEKTLHLQENSVYWVGLNLL